MYLLCGHKFYAKIVCKYILFNETTNFVNTFYFYIIIYICKIRILSFNYTSNEMYLTSSHITILYIVN